MESENLASPREPQKKHALEFAWQILVPILISVIIALGIGVLAVMSSINNNQSNELWADISLMFLILPLLFIGLILLVVVMITIKLIHKIHISLPPQFQKLDRLIGSVEAFTGASANKVTVPLILAKSSVSGATRLLNLAFHRRSNPKEEL